ncbi:hypothetical protein CBR_g30099 [Chara braunii]|uniref:Large ribosomal subunit protein bL9c n=1 Tax=Chara braunii TaxID=69332 RepID=A0A388LC22_CHABU|nr:hypothetical protein CBR_g30099 [Chara braunii]|eukprot:GBG79834.1 hypothetical protein CBR_g30099 [Chara braunii]
MQHVRARSCGGLLSMVAERTLMMRPLSRGYRHKAKLSVVLTTDVDGIGRHGDIVQVSPGYARNKLLPSKVALPALDKYIAMMKKQCEEAGPQEVKKVDDDQAESEELRKAKLQKEVEAIVNRISRTKVVLRRHTGESTTLRHPVTAADLIKEVRRQLQIEIWGRNVYLPAALTSLGEHQVPVVFPPGIALGGEKEQIHLQVRIRRK